MITTEMTSSVCFTSSVKPRSWNTHGNLVIRQHGDYPHDDPFIVICHHNLESFIGKLLDIAKQDQNRQRQHDPSMMALYQRRHNRGAPARPTMERKLDDEDC
jgi:hypothetical protein